MSTTSGNILDLPYIGDQTLGDKGIVREFELPDVLTERRWHDELTIRLRFTAGEQKQKAMKAAVHAMEQFLSPGFEGANLRFFEAYQRYE